MSFSKTRGTAERSTRHWVTPVPETAALAAHVRYLGEVSMLMRGPASGYEYAFTPLSRELFIDPRDADMMVQSGLFARL